MRHPQFGCLAAVAAVVALAVPSVASANEVTKWNELAVSTVLAQPALFSAPPAATVYMGIVQGAVYGAVNAADRHGRPYLINRSYPKASPEAAAATAAFAVLDHYFPGSHGALQTAYDASLAAIPAGASKAQGVDVGKMAADAMIAQGHASPVVITCTFGSGLVGVWQPLADGVGNPLCDPTAWVRDAVPFLVDSATQFRSPGPYPLSSAAYAKDLNEVEVKGSIKASIFDRTPAQTHAAVFWQSNPAPNYNAVARRFINDLGLGLSDSARLLAQLDLTQADAIITTWSDKYARNFWRPITAIRRTADPKWTPLFDPSLDPAIAGAGPALVTPPYPDHPSGATTVASAAMHAFAAFFGTDDMTFFVTSSRFPGEQRVFHHFSDLTAEVLEARIWAGIHFRNTDVQADEIGGNVSRYIDTHFFAAAH